MVKSKQDILIQEVFHPPLLSWVATQKVSGDFGRVGTIVGLRSRNIKFINDFNWILCGK